MAKVKLLAQAIFYPLPGEMDHFAWEMEGDHMEFVSAELWTAFLQNLTRKVPFVVEGQERVAHLEVEVMICD